MVKIKILDSRFNEAVKIHAGGSIFLGYLYAVIALVIPGFGEFAIGMPNLEVRLTQAGKPRVDFPEDERTDEETGAVVIDPETEKPYRDARYFSANGKTRKAITAIVFNLPVVARAVEVAERLRAGETPSAESETGDGLALSA